MDIERTFTVEADKDTTYNRLTTVLEEFGYKRMDSWPLPFYERGSMLGSLMGFSPKDWKVKVTFQMRPVSSQSTQVTITFSIDTTGQWVTEKERHFWNSELDGLESSVCSGGINKATSLALAQSSLMQNILACVVIIGLMAVFALGGYLLFASRFATCAGWMLGLVVGLVVAGRWLKLGIGGSKI